MQYLVFILLYPFLWLLSILPMRVLFMLSDILYIILYYVVGYRKKVVRHNLKLSFPEKSDQEIKIIEKKTFQHFIDVFMETIKSFTISEKELTKRVSLTNPEATDAYFDKNQSVVFVSGHYANWEWVASLVEIKIKHNLSVAFTSQSNKYFNNLIKKTRTKFGVSVVRAQEFYPYILNNLRKNNLQAYGFIADQSPMLSKAKYWSTFMGVEVPIIDGPETIARKLNLPVFYFHTERIKRGVYRCSFILLEDEPKKAAPHEITTKYIHELEKQIKKEPEFYFWTHKRFKHMGKKPEST